SRAGTTRPGTTATPVPWICSTRASPPSTGTVRSRP
ncbi:MAG: hypothetical protein AVDCRST_MAG70-375, partial [uncultured Thermomicrobiales bacterium]